MTNWDVTNLFFVIRLTNSSNIIIGSLADCEGFHVSPHWLEILVRCKGKSRVALISDGMSNTGREPGEYELVLRPADAATWKAINVWKLELTPVK